MPLLQAFSNGQAADLVLGHRALSDGCWTEQKGLRPSGSAVDPATGAVFVVERGSSRVLRFGALASLNNGASAEAVLGQPDFAHFSAAATAQGMANPSGVAVDSGGRRWVADTGNNRVLR